MSAKEQEPTGRGYAIARAVVTAVLVALCAASGFTAGADAPRTTAPIFYTWGP